MVGIIAEAICPIDVRCNINIVQTCIIRPNSLIYKSVKIVDTFSEYSRFAKALN